MFMHLQSILCVCLQCSLCVPTEEGMEVFLTTQASDFAQVGIAGILNKPQN